MARPKRNLYEYAWYHAMNRGNNHQDIFFDLEDRNMFLAILDHITDKYEIEIHSFCLMTNHYHLLIHTPEANLDKAMQYLNGVYTMRINRKYERDGQLFRGRYTSKEVKKDGYFIWTSKYIHSNPVDAGIVKNPLNYPWSSYKYFITECEKPKWVHTNKILECFGAIDPVSEYRKFVET